MWHLLIIFRSLIICFTVIIEIYAIDEQSDQYYHAECASLGDQMIYGGPNGDNFKNQKVNLFINKSSTVVGKPPRFINKVGVLKLDFYDAYVSIKDKITDEEKRARVEIHGYSHKNILEHSETVSRPADCVLNIQGFERDYSIYPFSVPWTGISNDCVDTKICEQIRIEWEITTIHRF